MEIVIPNYITRVKQSNARRAKFYIKGKSKKIPKRYLDTKKYTFNKKGILIDKKTKEPIIANPKAVGTPKFIKISGNALYSGYGNHRIRMMIVEGIKSFFRPFIEITNIPSLASPVYIDFFIYESTPDQDVDNKFQPYTKAIFDLFTDMKILQDDNPDNLRGYSAQYMYPDKNYPSGTMVIKIHHV